MKMPLNTVANPRWRAGLLLATTKLRALFALREVHVALVHDEMAQEIQPLLRTPNLLQMEDSLLDEWTELRPSASAIALESVAKVSAACMAAGLPTNVIEHRERLHLAAFRRLDSSVLGNELFSPCPVFLGVPHIEVTLSDKSAFKIGNVDVCNYYPTAATDAQSLERLRNADLVAEVERHLWPLLPEDGDLAVYRQNFEDWLELEPLRKFECEQKFPLFPRSWPTPFEGATPPPGYRLRFSMEQLESVGADLHTISLAGFSPYIAEVHWAYCEKHNRRAIELMDKIHDLALEHLVRHLRDVQVQAA